MVDLGFGHYLLKQQRSFGEPLVQAAEVVSGSCGALRSQGAETHSMMCAHVHGVCVRVQKRLAKEAREKERLEKLAAKVWRARQWEGGGCITSKLEVTTAIFPCAFQPHAALPEIP